MKNFPWDIITPVQFEKLCCRLLERLGYTVEWFSGPQDRGRDIRATRVDTDEFDRQQLTTLVVDCKRLARAVSVSDIQAAAAWADVRPEVDKLVIMTSSHLSCATRDWVEEWNKQGKKKIDCIEESRILDCLARFPEVAEAFFGEMYGKWLAQRLSNYSAYFSSLARLWGTAREADEHLRVRESVQLFQAFRSTHPQVAGLSIFSTLYVKQQQQVVYGTDGMSRIKTSLTRLNLSSGELQQQEFDAFSDVGFPGSGVNPKIQDETLDHELTARSVVRLENTKRLIVSVPLSPAIGQGEQRTISFEYEMLHRTPLAGSRHWDAKLGHFTAERRMIIRVPGPFSFSEPKVFRERGHYHELLDNSAIESRMSHELVVCQRCILPDTGLSVQFSLAKMGAQRR